MHSSIQGGKIVDEKTNHYIDMVMLAIVVSVALYSLWDFSVVSSELITILSSYSSVTSSGRIAKTHSLLKLYIKV